MQLQDMVGRIRKTLGEPEPNGYGTQQAGQGTWDNTQIIGYINEALGLMAHYWKKEKIGSITITLNGQMDFSFPSDALEDGIRTVSYVTGGNIYPIRYVDLGQYNRYLSNAIPYGNVGQVLDYVYTVFAGTIKLWPGAASTSDTLQPYYYRIPKTLSAASDVPEIPLRFHIAPIHYALRECQNAVEEANLESDANQKWNQLLGQFRAEMARNQRDRGVTVRGRR
jgi:hypothetical protein